MNTNIKEIAKRANVSIATVSRALSGQNNVREETKKQILRIARQLNYKPNLLARNFVKGKSNIIGLILPDISDEFFSEIIKSIDDTSFISGYFTMVISSHKNRSLVESIQTMMNSGIAGGFILLVPFMNSEIEKALKSERVPFVIISGDSELGDYDIITIDNYNAAYNAVKFLSDKGYKKIAHIAGPDENNDAVLRREGFLNACTKLKLETKKSWITKGDFTLEGGESAANLILNGKEKPEVIFAANDMTAIGCYNAASKLGLKIPDDIAIIGFDDVLISQYVNPPLTTIKVDTETIGKTAAEKLIRKMTEKEKSKPQTIKISTELVIRNSC